jgi:hypothetical protein
MLAVVDFFACLPAPSDLRSDLLHAGPLLVLVVERCHD